MHARRFLSSTPQNQHGRRVALVLVGLVVGGCRADSGPMATAARMALGPSAFRAARQAELYFTTEVLGQIEPCGCTTRPLGGLSKLAGILNRGQAARALVDAGNLLLPDAELDALTRPQHLAKARLIARAYRKMGVVAINLAVSDLREGTRFLSELQREGAVPLVSANIRPRGDLGPEVARSYVRTLGNIRFGVTGLAIPEQVAAASANVAALELAPAMRAELEVLKEAKAEVVVVLAHVAEADARALAEAVPEIDLILRAPGTPIERAPSPPIQVGPVIIAEAGQNGQHVGRARFALGKETASTRLALFDAGARALAERSRLERRIAALDREIERFSHDPSGADAARARQVMRDQLKRRLRTPPDVPGPPEAPHVEITLIPLASDLSDDSEMKKLLAGYYQTLREMNLERADPDACRAEDEAAPRYAGTLNCAGCHADAFAFWKRTKHAKAWETLEQQAKHYDLTCVGCHTVGFREPGGFCSLKDVKPFRDVGCESCHGPGSAHAKAPGVAKISRGANEATCAAGCHVPEHSDAFVYESYIRKVTGPGHPRREDR